VPLLTPLGVPFLTTLHNRLDTPGLPVCGQPVSDRAFHFDFK
jgi:hypothetical protein